MAKIQISDEFLLCRDLAHSWVPFNASVIRSKVTKRTEIHRVLTCQRCTTKRTQKLTSHGEIIANSYSYPDGYVRTGEGRMTVDDRAKLRLVSTEGWKQQ